MKKTLSMVLALVLAICMALPALAETNALPLSEETVNFTIMVKKQDLSQNTYAEKECVIYTEQKTNIHINWIEVSSSAWTEKVNLTLASGDLPDAFLGEVDVASNKDVLVPLNDLVDQYAPNVLQMFENLPDMKGALTLNDGRFYSLPIGDADTKNEINNEMWINTAWLKALNLEMPTTIEEFYNVLVAFRDGDPNGNGIQDEIPLLVSGSALTCTFDPLFGFFGTLEDDNHVRVQDGQIIFTPSEEGYYDALCWLHKLYSEGLMNAEYFTEDYQQYLAKGATDPSVVGVAIDWYIDNIITSSAAGDFAYIPPMQGVKGPMTWVASHIPCSPQGTLNGFSITTSCKNPELLVAWYDFCNSSLDILNMWNYGPENVIWRYSNDGTGRWEQFSDNVPAGSSSSQIRRTLGTGPSGPIYAYSRFRGPEVEKYSDRIAAKVAANEAYKPFLPSETISSGFGDADEEAERNMILTEIDHYLDQFKANAVVYGISEADWQKHLNVLKTLDVDEYVGYWQSYYDAHDVN